MNIESAGRNMRNVSLERMNDHFVKLHLGDGTVFHLFSAADGPRSDFHDHGQWGFWSTILEGGYVEEVLNLKTGTTHFQEYRIGDKFWIAHDHAHRIVNLTAPMTITYIEPEAHRGSRENWYQFRDDGFYMRHGNGEWERAYF